MALWVPPFDIIHIGGSTFNFTAVCEHVDEISFLLVMTVSY